MLPASAFVDGGRELLLDLDSVAAIIVLNDRYLLQHREDKPGVSYAGWWSLFGGAREGEETAEEALRREIYEELELDVPNCRCLMTCLYANIFEARTSRKAFFVVEIEERHLAGLVLHEGQGMAWFTLREILEIGARVVPYDIGMLSLYDRLRIAPVAAR